MVVYTVVVVIVIEEKKGDWKWPPDLACVITCTLGVRAPTKPNSLAGYFAFHDSC